MNDIWLFGDRLTAAGFRLAGVRIGDGANLAEWLEDPPQEATLVLVTADLAEGLPGPLLAAAKRRLRPLLLVMPDVRGRNPPPDVAAELKHQLGMAE
jgi:vacuolar-type H+-ATPase subunit F/Vma7